MLALVAFGVCAGNMAIQGELEELKPAKKSEYLQHLEEYPAMGNMFDPDAEAETKARLGFAADGGQKEAKNAVTGSPVKSEKGAKLPLADVQAMPMGLKMADFDDFLNSNSYYSDSDSSYSYYSRRSKKPKRKDSFRTDKSWAESRRDKKTSEKYDHRSDIKSK